MSQLKITQTLIEFEEKLTGMLEEIQTLKMHVYALEEQNETLRNTLLAQKPALRIAFETLQQIYQDGIHVCHPRFAELRTQGDCLFCLDFLKKEGQSKQ